MKYDICTCNILRDIAHNEMIIKYVSQHCNWCFLSKSARSNFFLLLQSLFSKLNEHWISLKWSHQKNREQKTKYKNISNCSNTKRRTRIFKILNKALYVHHWGNICKFFWQKTNTGMLRIDVFVDFSLTTEASLLFVRTPCINCYGGRVILYVAIFTGMLEVRR